MQLSVMRVKPSMPSSDAFWNLSLAFRDAADAAFTLTRASDYSGLVVVACVFLYFRCIELALKSVLLFHGLSESDITKTLGHRIADLLSRADTFPEFGAIGLSDADRGIIRDYSSAYSDKWFEYPEDPPAGYPDLETLRELAHRLSDRTRDYEHTMA
jgi:hypothetical protein